ncbi:30S ribosomal protein S17 [Candidatus Woesebacteria bacterium RIFCSPHIGHO2_01_FULL_39_17]|uniref:Small ribosomal subunit protein uS17 n=4 Tax=Microgenomates group TaxID=1794810 RepID=A0A0H4TEG0_9BACT|nr:30S ribosomal protein S17, small subunit ribosomal protein S17 [uncultured Microgenomates bacterium Rifle_16ft_4_minimus_954]KKQ51951.1 MAG: 30S ribosomal protein S17 [Microgenomates group bacterium GW2011_GWC1_38_12]KKQ94385.1 MAG: 30S ribosomal protein S17 [Candidatus Woesebacteria bacterium GW2011_GWB1_39_10b]KKR14397.1 MAG: 30S ribosomal protein S17 [Candidatus Woesebacteria bacterium GW2011_GWA1_39_21b]OGM23804.1 MAG: 30S ribosomal protein S17 [Candidatus Woesebacteria bacterium RIFCSPH
MKIFTGKVISKKMEKTATVVVERIVVHPIYRKRFKRLKKYHVHDEIGVTLGQTVKFVASRPYSKLKRWKVVEVVEIVGKESDKKSLPLRSKKPATTGSADLKRSARIKSVKSVKKSV